ncbi:MAG: hypothetical protein KC561_20110, partial [Myxococcales bacterium]|nr:hypothetical protein [Myxococcales bacterium]
MCELGRVEAHWGDDQEAAWAHFEKALQSDPSCGPALEFARDYLSERAEWERLKDVYEAALDLKRRHQLPFDAASELAEILWRNLDDWEGAEKYFKRLRLSEPKNPKMLAFYAEHYRRQGDSNRLVAILRTRRTVTENPKEWLEVALELAELAEGELGQPDRAIDAWKAIAEKRPDYAPAGEALRRLYTEGGKHNALLEYLRGELSRPPGKIDSADDEALAAEVARKTAILFEIADLYRERLELPGMEAQTYAEVLDVDPTNDKARDLLISRYQEAERWEELVEVYRGQASHEEDADKEAAVRWEVVNLLREKLGDDGAAVPELERIVEVNPGDREALGTLRELYEFRQEHRSLLRILGKEAELEEGESRVNKLRDVANIAWEELG